MTWFIVGFIGILIMIIAIKLIRSGTNKYDWKENYEKDFVDFIANSSDEDLMKWNR